MVSTTHKGCDAFAHVSISTLVFFTQRNPDIWSFSVFYLWDLSLYSCAFRFLCLTSEQAATEAWIRAWPFLFALLLSWTSVVHLLWQAQPLLAHTAALDALQKKPATFFLALEPLVVLIGFCFIIDPILHWIIGGFAVRSFHFWILQLKWARTLMAAGAVVMIISLCCTSYFRVFMVYLWWKVQCCLSTCVNLN